MASKTFTDEELNYFRICYIVTRVVPEELRKFFKQEWDKLFKATHGEWRDTAKNANDFRNMESSRNRTRNARLLAVMANGNTSEWDCTCLFYALLYSDSLGKSLKHSPEWNSVDTLRQIRNEVFAHTMDGSLTHADFQASIQDVLTAFSTLKLDPSPIQDMKNQTSFQTDELRSVQKELEKEKKRNAELFSFCVLPPKPSHDTTERTDEVSSIYQEMTKLRNAKKNETTVTYLSGNPGCGKSEMARQIGQKYFEEEVGDGADQRFVFTLNGFSLETLLQSHVEFAGRLNCDQDCITRISTAEDVSKQDKIVQIRSCIATRIQTYSSWLIIVDNIVDLKSVFQYLPKAGERTIGKGQILVTTQDSQSIPKSDSYAHHTSLSPGMKEEDAIALLCQVSGLGSKDDNTLKEVAKALDFQPLALACAAVYMQQICIPGKAITWEKYLEKLRNDQREATEAAYEETSLAYRATMTTAVKLALEREVDKNDVMMHAFQFLAYVAPDSIPLKYAVQYVKNCIPEQDEDLLAAKISSSSLIISSDDDSKEVRLHQVVYHCLQSVLSKRNTNKCDILNVILAFSDIQSFNMNEIDDIVETRKLVPHFASIATKLQPFIEARDEEGRASFIRDSTLCSKAAGCLSKICEICDKHSFCQASNICFRITLMIQQETMADNEDDPSLAITIRNIASSYIGLGQYEVARIWIERALSIQTNAYPNDHLSVADTLNTLASTLLHLGLFEQAETHLKRALVIQEKFYSLNFQALNSTLHNLGNTLNCLRQYEKAKLVFEESLVFEERISGEDHPNVAERLNNLATTCICLGQHKKAKECLERCLSILEKVYGVENPMIAHPLNNLAMCLQELGQYKEAKDYLERSLAINEKTLEPMHSLFGLTLYNLGCILIDMGQYEEARTYLERSLAIQENVYGENHPKVANTLDMLGMSLRRLQQYKKAKDCAEKFLAIRQKTLGPTHSSVGVSLHNLGCVLYDLGQYEEARTHFERALAITNAFGENDPKVATTLNMLGISLQRLQQYKEAKDCAERSLAIREETLGPTHSLTGDSLYNLGCILNDMGQYEEARAHLERSLAIQENVYGENHPEVANTLDMLGISLQGLQQYKEAKD